MHKYDNGTLNKRRLYIEPNQPEFFGIIALMNSMDDDFDLTESFKFLASLIKHPTPAKYINVTQEN